MKTIECTAIVMTTLLSLLLVAGCSDEPDRGAETAQYHLQKGHAAREAEDYVEAIRQYTLAIESGKLPQTDLAAACRGRGDAYSSKGWDQGDQDKGLADYIRAFEIEGLSQTELANVHRNRGFVYYTGDRDFDKALAAYTRAIELNPKDDSTRFFRGLVYKDKGESDKAIADFTEVIELNPQYRDVYITRGKVYKKMGEHANAIADFTTVVGQDPRATTPTPAEARYAKRWANMPRLKLTSARRRSWGPGREHQTPHGRRPPGQMLH